MSSVKGFLMGAGLIAGAELGTRALRIVTAIIMARTLEVAEFGLAAIVLTTWELVRMLTHNGLGACVVSAKMSELPLVCAVVQRLNWIVGLTIFAIQCLLAIPVAQVFNVPDAAPMLLILATTYLVNPIVMVHSFMAQRDTRLIFTAASGTMLAGFDNLATAGLALAGFGAWSVVLPKVLAGPFWVLAHMRWAPPPPRFSGPVTGDAYRHILGFSGKVFAAESLNTLRQHADRFVVGKFYGVEPLGRYAFAVNSGVGITTALATALGNAILPFLSREAPDTDLRARFWMSVKVTAIGVVPITMLQVSLAHWYVPLVFGERWASAAPLLSILCLMALGRVFMVPVTQLLRARGQARIEFSQSRIAAGLYFLALAVGVPMGLSALAIALVVATLLPVPLFVRQALKALDQAEAVSGTMDTTCEVAA